MKLFEKNPCIWLVQKQGKLHTFSQFQKSYTEVCLNIILIYSNKLFHQIYIMQLLTKWLNEQIFPQIFTGFGPLDTVWSWYLVQKHC